jgi:ABC-2 type transport system permease protein
VLRNVFLKTIRDRRRGLLWWSVGVFVFALFIGLFWPILRDSQDQLQAILANFPDELFGLFGVATAEEMFTPAGYLSSRAFGLIVPVVLAVYATAMGPSSSPARKRHTRWTFSCPIPCRESALYGTNGWPSWR